MTVFIYVPGAKSFGIPDEKIDSEEKAIKVPLTLHDPHNSHVVLLTAAVEKFTRVEVWGNVITKQVFIRRHVDNSCVTTKRY